MLIKCVCVLIWLALVPFSMGMLIMRCFKRENPEMISCIIAGYLVMFGLFEILSVPLVLLRMPFHVLHYTASAVFGILSLAAWLKYYRTGIDMIAKIVKGLLKQPWTIWAAGVFVLVQISFYVFGMATDLDDAYYVVTAGTALETDTMFRISPYTGLATKQLNLRYVLSPFPMLTAFFSKNCGFEAATMAHTVLPVFLVSLAYMIYYKTGLILFGIQGEKESEAKRSAGLFLCFLSLVHISSYYSVYTQGTFLLIRIWQGKAVLAAVLLPFLFYMSYKVMSGCQEKGDWILLALGTLSCCLVSSMGVVLAPVMTGIMAVICGIPKKKWSCIGRSILCCLPCAAVGIIYIIMKSLK